jgi:hypothetical protein
MASGGDTIAPSAKAAGPRQTRDEGVGDPRDNRGRHENEADGKKKNRAQIAPEIPPRSEECRGIEERRKKEEEN